MKDLIYPIITGVVVLLIGSWFNIGNTHNIQVRSGKVRKTGKWIMIISVAMAFAGLVLISQNSPPQGGIDFHNWKSGLGLLAIISGIIGYFIGKFIAWFQKP